MGYGAGFSSGICPVSRFIVRRRPTPRHIYVRKEKLCLPLPAFSALQGTVPIIHDHQHFGRHSSRRRLCEYGAGLLAEMLKYACFWFRVLRFHALFKLESKFCPQFDRFNWRIPMKLKSFISAVASIVLCLAVVLGLSFGPAAAASAENVAQGSPCLANNISAAKGGNYIGEWQIANLAGYGQPLTKVCVRGEVDGYNVADFDQGAPCYVKWADGPSFLGRLFYNDEYEVYGCTSN